MKLYANLGYWSSIGEIFEDGIFLLMLGRDGGKLVR